MNEETNSVEAFAKPELNASETYYVFAAPE